VGTVIIKAVPPLPWPTLHFVGWSSGRRPSGVLHRLISAPGAVVLAPDAEAARQLDLADGVIDGKYFGAPIHQKPPPRAAVAAPRVQEEPQGTQTHYPPPSAYPPRQYAEPVYHSRSITEVERPMARSYSRSPSPAAYGPGFGYGGYPATAYPRPADAGLWDEPLDPQNYGGKILSVDYVVHEPGWTGYHGLPPQNSYASPYSPTYAAQGPQTYAPMYPAPPQYNNGGNYLRSYPQPSRYQEQYDGPPRYTPPPQPPRYTPPPLAPTYDVPPPYTDPRTVPPPVAYDSNLRPWFGVALKWLDDLDQGGRNNVAVVHEVVPDSPAWKAGIQANDQLEYWENTKIDSEPVWKSKVTQIKIGDVINMGIHRNHRDQRVLVRIEGTDRGQGPKRVVQSQTAIHTDN
jgi:hypothetical protein